MAFPVTIELSDVTFRDGKLTRVLVGVVCRPATGAEWAWGPARVLRYTAWHRGEPVDGFDLMAPTPGNPTWHAWTSDTTGACQLAVRAAVDAALAELPTT